MPDELIEGQPAAPATDTTTERTSPIKFRTVTHEGRIYLAATIRVFNSSMMDSHAAHIGRLLEDGEDAESPAIRAELRKGLSELLAASIANDQWSAK